MRLTPLQHERNEWAERNFPGSPESESALGTIEEVGELAHCVLKSDQGIRGSQEEHEANAKDAIGDIVVYLLGIQVNPDSALGHAFGSIRRIGGRKETIGRMSVQAGKLMAAVHKDDRRSKLQHTGNLLMLTQHFCEVVKWDWDAVVTETWNRVKQRDWQKDKTAGGE